MTNSVKKLLSKLSDMHNAEQDRLQKEEKEGENFNVFSALNNVASKRECKRISSEHIFNAENTLKFSPEIKI